MSAPATASTPTESDGIDRRRSGLLVLGVVVAGALIALAAWVLLIRDHNPGPGPLESDEASSIGIGQPVGAPLGFGLPIAFNHGDKDAVLERIAIVDPPAGLKVIATRVAGPKRRVSQANTVRWPSERFTDLHPVSGYRVPPFDRPGGDAGAQLVFGLRADKPGRYTFKAVSVEYRVEDTPHRAVLHNGLRVCVVPRGKPRPTCPPPRNL